MAAHRKKALAPLADCTGVDMSFPPEIWASVNWDAMYWPALSSIDRAAIDWDKLMQLDPEQWESCLQISDEQWSKIAEYEQLTND